MNAFQRFLKRVLDFIFGREILALFEGNIAAGKSTVGEKLMGSIHFRVIEEPVAGWIKTGILDHFYVDPKRWAAIFQITAFQTRAEAWFISLFQKHRYTWERLLRRLKGSGPRVSLLERSVYIDREGFAKNCHKSELMNDTEWQIYCGQWDMFMKFLSELLSRILYPRWLRRTFAPDIIVYQYTPAGDCKYRIDHERERHEEVGRISIGYLTDLEGMHNEWLLVDFVGTLNPGDGRLVLGRATATVRSFRLETNGKKPQFVPEDTKVPVLVINGLIKYTADQLYDAIMAALN